MLLEEMSTFDNKWNFVQRPIHPGQGMNDSYWSLLAAIDQGWQIDEPVKISQSVQANSWNYQFTLTNQVFHQIRQIITPATPSIDFFIKRNNYLVEKEFL